MSFPVWKVDVDLANDPLAAADTWTDITADVCGAVEFGYGRKRPGSSFQPGRGSIVLENGHRKYDPAYLSSPYAGLLRPRRKIRIQARSPSGSFRPAFYGYIDDWQVDYAGNTCTVSFTDGLGLLAGTRMAGSVLQTSIADTLPEAWWRFNEPVGTTLYDQSGNLNNASLFKVTAMHATGGIFNTLAGITVAGDVMNFKVPNPAKYSEMPGWDVKGANDAAGVAIAGSSFRPRHPFVEVPVAARVIDLWSIEMWVRCQPAWGFDADGGYLKSAQGWNRLWSNGTDDDAAPILILRSSPIAAGWPNGLELVSVDANATTTLAASNISIEDDRPHHIVLTSDVSGINRLYRIYLDDVNVASVITPHYASTSHPQHFFYPDNISWFNGVAGELAIYHRTLSHVEVGANRVAGVSPFTGHGSGTRTGEILDRVGWPASRRSIDTGYITLGPLDLRGTQALELLRETAGTDAGVIYQKPDGDIRYRAKRWHTVDAISTTTQATIDDTIPGGVRLFPLRSPKYGSDLGSVINIARTSSDWLGFDWEVTQLASISDYGPKEKSVTSNARFTTDVEGLAGWMTVQYAVPEHGPRQVSVAPVTDLEIDTALALEVGSLVYVSITPTSGVGTPIVHNAVVQGVRVKAGPGVDRFELEFDLEPVPTGSAW